MAYTYRCSPYNSTPFSSCCNVACIGWNGRPATECESCGEKIDYDDGLEARRHKVGRDNCLMCGKPRKDCYC